MVTTSAEQSTTSVSGATNNSVDTISEEERKAIEAEKMAQQLLEVIMCLF